MGVAFSNRSISAAMDTNFLFLFSFDSSSPLAGLFLLDLRLYGFIVLLLGGF